jgi:hypothetical protein
VKPPAYSLDRRLPFDASQGRSKTEMRCPAKREMPVVGPANVESIRLRESLWVAVPRRHHSDYSLTLLNQSAVQFGIVRSQPRSVLAGRFKTQHFLHCGRNKRKVPTQTGEFLRMPQQS